jgi:NhaA family Na+:H+ antiporter
LPASCWLRIPFSPRRPTAESPSHRLERRLHKPVAYLILPLFALANTGVTIDAQSVAELSHANSLGIALGLVIGKPLGVILMCALAVKSGVSSLPPDVRWSHMFGVRTAGRHRVHDVDFHHQPGVRGSRGDGRFIEAHRVDRVVRCGLLGLAWLRYAGSETLPIAAASRKVTRQGLTQLFAKTVVS